MTGNKARWKLLGAVLTNYSYALIGVGGVVPMVTTGIYLLPAVSLGTGIVLLGIALYIAPLGETA